jgi:hypothetical protein
MMRYASFPGFLMCLVVVASLLAGSLSADAKGNCQANLVGKSYNCNFVDSNTAPFSYCVNFVTGGVSKEFDMVVDGATDYGCACQSKGSFKSPSYDTSANDFLCDSDFGTQLDGKVSSNKLSGQGIDYNGNSIEFSCHESSTPCPI